MTHTAENPMDRPTARVLLLDDRDRLLLFRAGSVDPETGLPFWFPPGGGVEPGESHEEAAVRELFEETGMSGLELSPCIWFPEHVFDFDGKGTWWRVVEQFFVARATTTEVSKAGWTELERECPLALVECRWWSLEEIRAATDIFVPRSLPSLLPAILAGELPAKPVEVGL